MNLQEFLLNQFKGWKPTAPEVVNRTKRDITLSWNQEQFGFLEDELLYRVEKNNKLPKWILVYSGGKTLKRIDDLAPSHPHKFRLKVILKASAVPRLAEIALKHYGNQNIVYQKLCENVEATDELNIETNVEVTSEPYAQKLETGTTVLGTKENINKFGDQPNSRGLEKQKWIESVYSEETWTNTDFEGTSAVCFCMAVKCGYLKQLQMMLDDRPELIGIVNASTGFTPLATAVRQGDINTTKFLLTLGAEVDQKSCAGQTPLHLAVFAGNMPIVEHLIEKGAEFQARDWNDLRVEHYAVESCNLEMVKLIFDRGGDVSVKDNNGWSPLFRALCQGAKTEIIEELVMRGSDVDAVDNAGLPLTSAARLLKNRGRNRDSILRLVDRHYPHEKALANFTRLTKKIYNVHTMLKFA